MFYNGENDMRYIAGTLRLCPVCRKRLQNAGQAELIPVLESILGAYTG
jgi:hypothetical protein